MSSLRKALSIAVVFAMVFTLMIPAFAATPTDVLGTDYEDSVGKLNVLGILEGYPDGTFKPDQNITRAEFAKIAVYTIGLQSAAELSKGTTKFGDVSSSHWASGFINIASDKGLIIGYPDKTFKPEANVSYAEAITILVRALGMGPVVEGKGTWPANYLAKASEAGITDDVGTLSGNEKAIRGVISQLAWNTLEAEKWGEKEYTSTGVVYGPLGKSLLQEKYSNYVYKDANDKYVPKSFEDVEVIGTQLAGGYAADEIRITKDGLDALLASDTETVEVIPTDVDLNALFGKKVDLLFGKDNKIAFIKVASTDVVEGLVSEFNTTDDKVKIGSKEYSFASDAKIYVNTKSYTTADFDTIAAAVGDSAARVTLVLNNGGKVSAMNMFVADNITLAGITMKQFVVKEVNSNNEVKNAAAVPSVQFDLDTVTEDTDKCIFVKNGKNATKDDIKAGDAVTYINNDDLYYIVITDNKVTGTISKISADDNGASSSTRKKITIDSKEYTMTSDNSALMTKTANVEDVTAIGASISDFYNKEVTLTLNAAGEIILLSGSVKGSSSLEIGVVTKAVWEGTPDADGKTTMYIQILNAAGEKKAYVVKGDKYKDVTGTTLSNYTEVNVDASTIAVSGVVLYDVSADGTIKAAELYDITGQNISDTTEDVFVKLVDVSAESLAIKDKTQKVTVAGTDYFAESTTAYLNSDTTDSDNPAKIADWAKLVSADKALATNVDGADNLLDNADFYMVYDEDNMIKTIIVNLDTTTVDLLGSTAQYGIYIETENQGDDDIIRLYVDGQEVSYTVANGVYDQNVSASVYYVEAGDLVKFELNGDGEFDGGANTAEKQANFIVDASAIDENEADADKVKYVNATSRIVTFEASAARDGQTLSSVVLASDVAVYDVRDGNKMGSLSDLAAGQFIVVTDYDATDDVFGTVVIVK